MEPPAILSHGGCDNTHAKLLTREALPALVSEFLELRHEKHTVFRQDIRRASGHLQDPGAKPNHSLGEVNPLIHTGANQKM